MEGEEKMGRSVEEDVVGVSRIATSAYATDKSCRPLSRHNLGGFLTAWIPMLHTNDTSLRLPVGGSSTHENH